MLKAIYLTGAGLYFVCSLIYLLFVKKKDKRIVYAIVVATLFFCIVPKFIFKFTAPVDYTVYVPVGSKEWEEEIKASEGVIKETMERLPKDSSRYKGLEQSLKRLHREKLLGSKNNPEHGTE